MSSEVKFSNLSKEQIESLMVLVESMGGATDSFSFETMVARSRPWPFRGVVEGESGEKRVRELEHNVARLIEKDALRELKEFPPIIVAPNDPGVGFQVDGRNYRWPTFETKKDAEDFVVLQNVLSHCMEVAHKIGMANGDSAVVPIFNKYQKWHCGNSEFPHHLFKFDSDDRCDLFIRSVGEERLNVVFNVKN